MLPLKFTYLFGSSSFFIPWLLIFLKRKDLQKLIIFNSLLFSVLGIIFEYFFWIKDWWQPYTITNTRVGIEDLILGFSNGGIAASLYFYIFNKKLITPNLISKQRLNLLIGLIIASIIFFFILVYIIRIFSFWATIIVSFVFYMVLALFTKTLIQPSILNGILLVILVVPIFLSMILVTPDFVEKTWILKNLLGIKFMGVPIEDYVFYFLCGMVCFLVYPFLFENVKLTKNQ